MKRMLISLIIVGIFAGPAVCPGQIVSEIPVESGESAIEVIPEEVQLPADLEEQLNRLFDPNEVFISEALYKKLEDHAKVFSSDSALRALSSGRPRQHAVDIRGEIQTRLKEGLASEHLEIRRRAALALNAIGDKSGVPVMIEDMAAADPNDRADVVVTLRKIKDRRAIPALIKAVDDKTPYIRCIAIEALGEMKADEAYDVIVKHLNDKEKVKGTDVIMLPAGSACFALGEIGERKAVPLLIKALENEELKEGAAKALEKIRLGRYFVRRIGDSGFGTDVKKWKNWWQWENLDGTGVKVRLYRNWMTNTAAYEKVGLKVKNYSVSFDALDANEGSIVAVLAKDQDEEVIKRALKNRIYVWPFSKNLRMRLPDYNLEPPADTSWFFDDALGELIPNATVEIYLNKYKGPRIKLGETVIDGSFKKPAVQDGQWRYEFIIYHPDYGIANVRAPYTDQSHILTPLVQRTSTAATRAIWGVVLGPDGNPIEGATIKCINVRTLGEGLINSGNERSTVLTDADGGFCAYMPPSKQYQDQRGKLIPPKSKYQVRIEAPKEMGLLPYVGQMENGRETTVVMESPGNFHTFTFVDEYGVIDAPAGLEKIILIIERGEKGRLTLGYSDWKEREAFPNGTYVAELISSWRPGTNHGRIKFEPVEITGDSPEEIVLMVPEGVTYTGRVVHGITGEPFAGAYVITMESGSSKRLEDITPDQWAAIHELGDDISVNDLAVNPIKKAYGFGEIVRTDMDGYYRVATKPGKDFYTFLAFEENFIAVSKRMYPPKGGSSTEVTVATLKLFGAGKVL
ncbi:MAG TPA: HEAT repeat domain-containing protein, partial [Sedimentisphaerales bacterium]|nr:HEAT repeat domain-containing protein [Sedimentisphaerales bacterium]